MATSPSPQVLRGYQLTQNQTLTADVVVIGSGAGGGVTAETLAKAGLKVVLLEEGGYRTSKDFHMREAEAYPTLYYDVAGRKTKDKGITVLQGRTVGGTTVVNWTTCFRTPPETLAHWTKTYGVKGFTPDELAPWFAAMEKRLNIEPWRLRNPSNDVLYRGAQKLGWHADMIARNVKACRNLGYCGVGCPVDAKQSMLVTTIPSALEHGAVLIANVRAQTLEIKGDRVVAVNAIALNERCVDPTGVRVRVEAPHVVLAGGAINNPALLLRSKAPDPYNRVGRRTFLHVTNASGAVMPERTQPFDGAPQSAYSNQFLYRDGVTGKIGYKLEVAPVHPILAAVGTLYFGQEHADSIARLPHLSTAIALMRDGFHADSPGGTVTIADDGSPVLDYPMTDYLWEGIRHAYLSMAECQFAAGATHVLPAHMDVPSTGYGSWAEAKRAIESLPLKVLHAQLFSAHVMGGCGMGEDPKSSVVNSQGKHHQLANLWIIDGSTFPTSLGANPSLSIYGMAARQSAALAEIATGRKKTAA
ncbi:MAG: GMC family oxidoreductase N-terminal domain-containing protein [Sulfurifustaceae bacterium]